MICLHDVDVIKKLAACGILSELATLLGVDDTEIFLLSSIKYQVPRLLARAQCSQATIQRAAEFCRSHPPIPALPEPNDYEALLNLGPGMESGEALLYASAMVTPNSLAVSGDKHAFRKLGALPAGHRFLTMLQGRVICFEELLLRYHDAHGYERLRLQCGPVAHIDGVLRLAFSSGELTPAEQALPGIYSHLREVHRISGGLQVSRNDLAAYPPP